MKPALIFVAFIYSVNCYAQSLNLDISLPQPRLGESFYLSIKTDTISKQVFRLAPDKFKVDSYLGFTGQETSLSVQLEALKVGPNEIGPMSFNLNGKIYKTDIIRFTVAEPLPNVDKGIWIRKVPLNDTTVYILIDQRIPTHNSITKKDGNGITVSAEVNDNEKETVLRSGDIENVKIEDWGSSSTTIPNFTGKELSYASYYKCYKVTKKFKSQPVVINKQAFDDLPAYYQFQNIIID